jgi:hypothetical protein
VDGTLDTQSHGARRGPARHGPLAPAWIAQAAPPVDGRQLSAPSPVVADEAPPRVDQAALAAGWCSCRQIPGH